MTTGKATMLVARREIVERVRQRSFLISTGVTLLLLAGVILLPAALGAGGDRTITVVTSGQTADTIALAAAKAAPQLDVSLDVGQADTDSAARQQVEDGEADLAVVGDPPKLVAENEVDADAGALLQQAAGQLTRERTVEGLGIEPSARDELLRPPPLETVALDPDSDSDEAQGLASIAVLLLYGQLIVYGYWIASGILEEKTSRIVEVLLSTIPATALLRGKLLGLGVLGFVQLLVVGVVGAGLAIAAGVLDVPSGAVKAFAYVLAFFVLGYAFYAAMYAVAGATVQRQEDLQSSTMPLTIVVIVAFFFAFQAVQEPDGTASQIATLVPATMPMVMPARLLAGDVAAWEVAAGVAISVASSALLIAAAARIYSGAIMKTGGKVRILDAWRAG